MEPSTFTEQQGSEQIGQHSTFVCTSDNGKDLGYVSRFKLKKGFDIHPLSLSPSAGFWGHVLELWARAEPASAWVEASWKSTEMMLKLKV